MAVGFVQLALNGLAPAVIIFHAPEQILTLGSIVCDKLFAIHIPIVCLTKQDYATVANGRWLELRDHQIIMAEKRIDVQPSKVNQLNLTERDHAYLRGDHGQAAKIAMETICIMAAVEDADDLIPVEKGHIDGCILAHEANLIFAERMLQLNAKVSIPTTMNAISVDREKWQNSGVSNDFGHQASRLADAYGKWA